MNKKYIIAGIVIIIILLIIGITQFTDVSSQDNIVKVGNAVFTLPEGYKVVESNTNEANISNNFNTITIKCLDDENVNQSVHRYVKFKGKDNITVNLTTLSVDGKEIQKSKLENTTDIVHYWFKDHNKVYTIYTTDANKNIDKIVFEIIKSIEPA